MSRSKVISLVGLSGAGKSHLIDFVVSQSNIIDVRRLIAVTTRHPRVNEIDGRDKYFRTPQQFLEEKQAGLYNFINTVYKKDYAYLKSDFKTGHTYICELYYKNYFEFKQVLGTYCTSICIRPVNEISQLVYLKEREESEEEYIYRKRAISEEKEEVERMTINGCFDYVIDNDFTYESEVAFLRLINKIIGGVENDYC